LERNDAEKVKVGYEPRSSLGGCLSLLALSFLLIELYLLVLTIFVKHEYTYVTNKVLYAPEEMENFNVSLGKYNNSANFIFGLMTNRDDFDVLNNPYIEFVGL
jgi:hypothetical protein